MSTLRALTLWRPWPWAIFHAGKPVENRDWPCPLPRGAWYAIHGGKTWDEEAAGWLRKVVLGIPCCPPEAEHPMGIVGLVKHGGDTYMDPPDGRWRADTLYGWRIEHAIALPEPIPCRGMQGLWSVPAEVAERVLAAAGPLPGGTR